MKSHGGDILDASERTGIPPEEILDFSSNLNPLGPPPQVRDILANSMPSVTRYPDVECRRLRRYLANALGLHPDRILIGNGSTELIYLLARRMAPRRVATFPPCYQDYWRASEQAGADVAGYISSAEDEFALPASSLEPAGAMADMVWIGNPNNPTGTLAERDAVLQLARAHPDTVFVVDEAFMEFLPDCSQHTLLTDNAPPNVAVLRSLTKFFAVPGLRLGFLAAPPQLVRQLAAAKEPWTVNGPALAVGEHLYDDPDYISRSRTLVAEEREFLLGELAAMPGLHPFPSRACFVLVRLDTPGLTAPLLKQRLLEHHILIRDASNFRGLDSRYVRFAVKAHEDNARLLEALKQVLAAVAAGGPP